MIKNLARATAWLLVIFVVYSTLSPIGLRPETGQPAYVERFAAFLALGTAFGVGYPKRRIWIAFALVLGAMVLEASQNLVPTRHGRLLDGMEKGFGGLAGLALAALIGRLAGKVGGRRIQVSKPERLS